jgi:hypothetical protein
MPDLDDPAPIAGLEDTPRGLCCGAHPPTWDGQYDWPRCRNAARPQDPTPDEIRQRCVAVRAGWSENEYRRRAGEFDNLHWEIPNVAVAEVIAAQCQGFRR